jgi:hypothetical protein
VFLLSSSSHLLWSSSWVQFSVSLYHLPGSFFPFQLSFSDIRPLHLFTFDIFPLISLYFLVHWLVNSFGLPREAVGIVLVRYSSFLLVPFAVFAWPHHQVVYVIPLFEEHDSFDYLFYKINFIYLGMSETRRLNMIHCHVMWIVSSILSKAQTYFL